MEEPSFPFNPKNNSKPEDYEAVMARVSAQNPSNDSLRSIFSILDFTTLDGTDHPGRIDAFCRKALGFGEKGLPTPAAVCIYPPFIAQAKKLLKGTQIRVATTAAAFPSGQLPLALKLNEIRFAVDEGADEIDVVISRGTFMAGGYDQVAHELKAMREACGALTLKVILETGELNSDENITKASETAIHAGADFIKTSTGKSMPAATPHAVYLMLKVIRQHYTATGRKVGIKPAGGIADAGTAFIYYGLVHEFLGREWLSPGLFRIGASRLADDIANALALNG